MEEEISVAERFARFKALDQLERDFENKDTRIIFVDRNIGMMSALLNVFVNHELNNKQKRRALALTLLVACSLLAIKYAFLVGAIVLTLKLING